MSKRKYSREDYQELCKKLRKIEKQVQRDSIYRRRIRVLSSSSASDADESSFCRSQYKDYHHSQRSTSETEEADSYPETSNHSPIGELESADAVTSAVCASATAATTSVADGTTLATVDNTSSAADVVVPPGSLDDTSPAEIDANILEILGVDPTNIEKFGKDIQKEVAVRFEYIATNGLSKEDRKEISSKYLIPGNCKLIGAPTLNPEINAALSETVTKRDLVIESKQKLLASAISSLSEALTMILSTKEKNTELLRLLMDTGKTMCDCQYHETNVRRNFVTFAVKKDMKESLKNAKIDNYLFGQNLAETLKTAKAINKQGAELKPASVPKPSTSKTNVPSSSKNWRGQVRANTARTYHATAKTAANTTATATRNQRGSSSKRSQSHRSNYSRR